MQMRRTLGVLILIIAVFGSAELYAQKGAVAVKPVADLAPAVDAAIQPVQLLVGRSTIVNIGAPIARVSLTSADVADAVVTAPAQLLLNGKAPGTISMFVWERGGGIRRYEVNVQRDLGRLEQQIQQIFPKEQVEVRANGKNIVLSGKVTSKDVMDKLNDLAGGFVESKSEVVSLLQLAPNAPSNQVLLRVRFAEVSRSAMTQLGVGFFTSPTGIKNTIARTTTQQFPAPDFSNLQSTKASSDFGSAVTSASGSLNFSDFLNLFLFNEKYDLGAVIKALQNHGLFQSLAEPNLVAESGKEASFLAGGEFPVPVPQASAGGTAITVQYKEFGIRLNFTPIVNGNRVHLKLRPEVSTLDFGNAITLQGFKIPALSTRRTETEIELDNNQTFAIAGLMNNQVSQTMSKIPGIGDIPILGLLFKSKEAQKDQTQLVVMITPEILPLNSTGVTTTLPRQAEPYLPPLPDKKSFEPPAPAFPAPPAARPDAQVQPAPTAGQPNPQAAADAMKALSPLTRAPNVHAAPTPGPGQATESNREGSSGAGTADSAASNVSAASTAPAASVAADAAAPAAATDTPTNAGAVQPQLSDADKKAAAKAAQEQAKKDKQVKQRQAALARQKAERDAKAAKKAHDAELRRQAAERKAAQKKAAEDARKAKEAAQKAKEQAKREEEAREKRDQEIAEAQAKIQAAETAFLEETSKRPNE